MCKDALKDAWRTELVDSLESVQIEGKKPNEIVGLILETIKMAFVKEPSQLGLLANYLMSNIGQFDLKKIESAKTGKEAAVEILNQLAQFEFDFQKEVEVLVKELDK